ncbi:MAG: type I pullulanase [Tenericutes bacterium]|nr:type I pullulanase [Mycoplasmatota bacterium]
MKVFIEGFNLIRIESHEYIYKIELENNEINWLKNEGFNQFFVCKHPITLHQNDIIHINDQIYPLQLGLVTLTPEFEKRFRYDGPLGYVYNAKHTDFYLFSPVAKEVYVVIENNEYKMTYEEPIWKTTVDGNQENKTYTYKIRLVDHFKEVRDPYTIAASIEGSHIIDWDQTTPIEKTNIKVKNYVDTVIYEGHIRDMSINLDVDSKGLYEGVIEYSHTLKGSVLEYIKKLGMTHLQVLPVFDFEDVDDVNKDELYNWGYNPSQYFSLEGWYSKNPYNPYDRINSFKKVVNQAHQLKLGINMDVVYNHVYQYKTFPYDDIVPGYFYRHDRQSKMTDASYCGNDIETRNYMVRRLIVDSLAHYAKNYQIDGFRFDLMGLMDLETMHEIEKRLMAINPYIMLYGEGWNMQTEVSSKQRSNMHNQASFPSYAHFNDFYRNTMKGELHGDKLGYTMGNNHLSNKAMQAILGSPHMFLSPNQSINYVECHDNLTYYDKMLLSYGNEDSKFKVYQDFANHLIAISQGVPFYHAGQEFYRSKKGVENSYNSSDEINQIEWNIHEESVKKLKKLLKLRKKYRLYRQISYEDFVTISKDKHLLIYKLENDQEILLHYIKNDFELEGCPIHGGKLIFPSQKALTKEKSLIIDQPGIYIIYIKK